MTTTTTERLDLATHQHRWTDELASMLAPDRRIAQRRHVALRLVRLDHLFSKAKAQIEYADALAELQQWSVIPDKWPESRHEQRYKLWLYAVEHGKLTELEKYYVASLDETRDWAPFVDADEPITKPVSSLEVPPDAATNVVGGWVPRRPENILKEAYDQALVRRVNEGLRRIAPAAAEFPGALPATPLDPVTEYQQRPQIDDEPLLRRVGEALKQALLRVDRWAERIGEDKK